MLGVILSCAALVFAGAATAHAYHLHKNLKNLKGGTYAACQTVDKHIQFLYSVAIAQSDVNRQVLQALGVAAEEPKTMELN